MSWFTKALNTLAGDEEEDDVSESDDDVIQSSPSSAGEAPEAPSRDVKEDISEITKTLARQFRGVASFLAPPPDVKDRRDWDNKESDDAEGLAEESRSITGIRSDLAEIGGRFRNGVSEMSKLASSLLQFDEFDEGMDDGEGIMEEEEGFEVNAPGVNEEVLMFVQSIAMYRGTWLDFPLIDHSDDFEMSNSQNEHAMAVEHLVPTLANLRNELCPCQMSECCFWKIYFVLLHPKLSMHEADVLSTSQVLDARAMLLQDLHSQTKPTFDTPEPKASKLRYEALDVPIEGDLGVPLNLQVHTQPLQTVASVGSTSGLIGEIDIERRPIQPLETEVVDKSVIQEQTYTPSKSKDLYIETSRSSQHSEEDGDNWLENDAVEAVRTISTSIPIEPEEDVFFSDLEEYEDETGCILNSDVDAAHINESDDSKDWVQLNKAANVSDKDCNSARLQREGSDDWLNIEDIDVE